MRNEQPIFDFGEPLQDFSRPTSEQTARDEALARVLENAGTDWKAAAMVVFHALPPGQYVGEDIRMACEVAGVSPHHNNAWGGFIAGLVKGGYLIPTNRQRSMKAKGSHARKTQIYVKRTQAKL